MEGVRYRERAFRLEPGDTIYVYTDGVPEAQNGAQAFFGTDRLLEALDGQSEKAARKEGEDKRDYTELAAVTTSVKNALSAFVGNAPQFDDITMLCFRYYGE
jgi:sigma-B regulation protein RsbU (phosphoserine phosphatase)